MVLKRLLDTLNSIFDFFEKSVFFFDFFWFFFYFFFLFWLSFFLNYYIVDTPFWIFLPFFWIFLTLFGSSYPFLRKGGKSRKSIFGTRSSPGWVLIHLGRTTTSFQNFSIYIIYLKNGCFMNNSSLSDYFIFSRISRYFFQR